MPTTDLPSHAPWLESQRRSRARRFDAARRLRRLRGRRSPRRGARLAVSVAAGGAVAAGGTGTQAVQSAGSSVSALQQALGIPADGIYGPQTRRAVRALPGSPRPRRRRHRRSADARRARAVGGGESTARPVDGAVLERIAAVRVGRRPDDGHRQRRTTASTSSRARPGGGRRPGNPAQALRGRAGPARGAPVPPRGHGAVARLRRRPSAESGRRAEEVDRAAARDGPRIQSSGTGVDPEAAVVRRAASSGRPCSSVQRRSMTCRGRCTPRRRHDDVRLLLGRAVERHAAWSSNAISSPAGDDPLDERHAAAPPVRSRMAAPTARSRRMAIRMSGLPQARRSRRRRLPQSSLP